MEQITQIELQPTRPAYRVSHGLPADCPGIYRLYREVASRPGGLARSQAEISETYVRSFVEQASCLGVLQVARRQGDSHVIGEVHAHPPEPSAFSHVLSNLTLAVTPHYQGLGIGSMLMRALLRQVQHCHPHIERVELVVRESNRRAIHLYERLGFTREGLFQRRIRSVGGGYEADIPMAWLRREPTEN